MNYKQRQIVLHNKFQVNLYYLAKYSIDDELETELYVCFSNSSDYAFETKLTIYSELYNV